jgi:SecD/SecF fusion protein
MLYICTLYKKVEKIIKFLIMQSKGLIKFVAIIIALVCVYQLMFTYVAGNVENDAKKFAKGKLEKEVKYLDSIKDKEVYNIGIASFTYDEVSKKKINKGLDLEGGLNLIVEISVKDILKGLSNNSKNEIFNKSLDDAKKNIEGNQTYLESFFETFESNANNTIKLSSPEIFSNKIMGEQVNFKMSNNEVQKLIEKKVDESVNSAFDVIRKRIDKFGVTQPNLQRLGNSGRILIEMPGAKDINRIKKLVSSTAQLEFWETYNAIEFQSYFMTINETLKKSATTEVKDTTSTATSEIEKLLVDPKKDDEKLNQGPIFGKMMSPSMGGAVVGYFSPKDTEIISEYLNRSNIKNMLPMNLKNVKFLWGKPTQKKFLDGNVVFSQQPEYSNPKAEFKETIELYVIKSNKEGIPPISGGVINDARDTFDNLGKPSVEMAMDGYGSKLWEELTGKVYNQKNSIAIVLDDVVYSAPGVNDGAIAGGRSVINGDFNVEETKDLANVLRAGKLPAQAAIVQSDVVGPSLGQEAVDNGFMSFIIGLILVALWMILYYGKSGIYANVSLVVNILFIIGILASLGAVLTLPGIAGIVLTIGMAVDANVIIYERAKEELEAGKTSKEAIDYAYTWKGAMSSIFDANITTALTAIILLVFGTGPIQGFATTLLIGIGTSLFTAIFVTRILLDWGLSRKEHLTFDTPMSHNWFKNMNIDFLGKKKIAYIVSGIFVIVSIISLFTNGFNQGVDFVGGRTFQVRFDKAVVANEVATSLTKTFGENVEAKVYGTDNQLKITTKYKVAEESVEIDDEVNLKLFNGLKQNLPANLTYEDFTQNNEGKKYGILQSTKVGPTIAADIKKDSLWAVLGSLAVVFVYLMISFRKWQYSLGAVVAVAHDAIIVMGVFSLFWKILPFNMEIDQAFIAAILTVIGYSLNDTVIVYDRMRDYIREKISNDRLHDVVNSALNTTLSRTLNTSFTTLIVLIAIFILGGETIRGFVFAILVGIFVGTYSSLFIATPITYDTLRKEHEEKKV